MVEAKASRFGRPFAACSLCRKRKLKCDREHPCRNCLRSRSTDPGQDCVYEDVNSPNPWSKRRRQSLDQRGQPPSYAPRLMSPTSPSPSSIERTISTAPNAQSSSSLQMMTSRPSSTPGSTQSQASEAVQTRGPFEHDLFGETYTVNRGVAHKSRLFGQSHWITIIASFRDLFETAALGLKGEHCKAVSGMRRCKALAKVIKSHRTPTWPTPPTAILPPKAIADSLMDSYLGTIETVYRVVHIPSFKKDYESLWLRGSDKPLDKAFLIQLKLVLAIGATTYDDNFSLRTSAVTWVYEAQTYMSEPIGKSRFTLQSLQTSILLLMAQEATGIDGHSIWISVGALIRTAMHMGLHKNPADLFARPKSKLIIEMRLRLWNTILELALQSSLVAGKPPLVSVGDFEARPPSNLDDDQLTPELDDPIPKPDNEFTQTSIPIALRKTFQLRLAIANMLNGPGSQGTYEETKRLDEGLRALYKDIFQNLQLHKPVLGASASRFNTCALDVIIHRYILSLHVPFLNAALHETAYAYSRKVVVDSALRIWCTANPSRQVPHGLAVRPHNSTNLSTEDEFSRFVCCGSGFFRTAAFQATLVAALELKTQLQEQASLGPVILRPDLLAVLEYSKHFSLRCVEAGETNVKGYLLHCLVASYIDGLHQGLGQEELQSLTAKAAEDAIDVCLPLLEKMHVAGQEREEQTILDTGFTTPAETSEYSDSLTFGMLSYSDNDMFDLMNWIINDDGIQEVPKLDREVWV